MIEVTSSNWTEAWTFPPGTTVNGLGHFVFGPGVGDSSSFSPNIPNVNGYNISFFKSGAQQGYQILADEEKDPLLAHHQYGLGKVGAYTGQIGGSDGANLVAWNGYGALFNIITEGLLSPNMGKLRYVNVEQNGNRIVYTIESTAGAPVQALSKRSNGSTEPLYFIEIQDACIEIFQILSCKIAC